MSTTTPHEQNGAATSPPDQSSLLQQVDDRIRIETERRAEFDAWLSAMKGLINPLLQPASTNEPSGALGVVPVNNAVKKVVINVGERKNDTLPTMMLMIINDSKNNMELNDLYAKVIANAEFPDVKDPVPLMRGVYTGLIRNHLITKKVDGTLHVTTAGRAKLSGKSTPAPIKKKSVPERQPVPATKASLKEAIAAVFLESPNGQAMTGSEVLSALNMRGYKSSARRPIDAIYITLTAMRAKGLLLRAIGGQGYIVGSRNKLNKLITA